MSEHTRSRSQHRRPTDNADAVACAAHIGVDHVAVDLRGPADAAGRGDRP